MSTSLDRAVAGAGYYPELVAGVVKTALGKESPREHFVHAETTFDDREVRRHMTVLVLTATRLIRVHIDDASGAEGEAADAAIATTESVILRNITSVSLNQVVREPERYGAGDIPGELVLAVGWGIHSRVDLEPATCGDENCEADHGYSGAITGDDALVRVSALADGDDSVRALQSFSDRLQEALGEQA